ncbi:hypothetical protein [Gracilibacillus salitolerans]|uniref:hypothetical protein n=1 Tax=Gracilibacillus salitolerans TaxID=2663022 RepID=UPI001E55D08E|nr:hypothetical protein [Gracilibacillus salitolerans]
MTRLCLSWPKGFGSVPGYEGFTLKDSTCLDAVATIEMGVTTSCTGYPGEQLLIGISATVTLVPTIFGFHAWV